MNNLKKEIKKRNYKIKSKDNLKSLILDLYYGKNQTIMINTISLGLDIINNNGDLASTSRSKSKLIDQLFYSEEKAIDIINIWFDLIEKEKIMFPYKKTSKKLVDIKEKTPKKVVKEIKPKKKTSNTKFINKNRVPYVIIILLLFIVVFLFLNNNKEKSLDAGKELNTKVLEEKVEEKKKVEEEKPEENNKEKLYELGKDKQRLKKYINANIYFKKACILNHAQACNNLGFNYSYGNGVSKDYNKVDESIKKNNQINDLKEKLFN